MHRLETPGDFLVYSFIALLFVAAGALAIAFPSRYVSEDPSDYARVTGILSSVQDVGGRRSRIIEFTLESHSRTYKSRLTPYRNGADQWKVGRTRLRFLIERNNPEEVGDRTVIQVYALSADGAGSPNLLEDIAETNRLAGTKFGVILLLVGLTLCGGGLLAWHRRIAA